MENMLTLDTLRREKRAEILHRAEMQGCRNVRVFGSVATGESRADSDIDFLVDLDQGVGCSTSADWSRIFRICWESTWIW
jgi:predicted nucleotidyltransferase